MSPKDTIMLHFLRDLQAILPNPSGSGYFKPRRILNFDIILFFMHEITLVHFRVFKKNYLWPLKSWNRESCTFYPAPHMSLAPVRSTQDKLCDEGRISGLDDVCLAALTGCRRPHVGQSRASWRGRPCRSDTPEEVRVSPP